MRNNFVTRYFANPKYRECDDYLITIGFIHVHMGLVPDAALIKRYGPYGMQAFQEHADRLRSFPLDVVPETNTLWISGGNGARY